MVLAERIRKVSCYFRPMLKALRLVGLFAIASLLISIYTPLWNHVGAAMTMSAHISPCDAIVVLAAGLKDDGTLNDESLRRTVAGIELFKSGLAPTLILSGSFDERGIRATEADLRARLATTLGIPSGQIVRIYDSKTTYEEAQHTALVLGSTQKRVLLVTETLHMIRASGTFEKLGMTVFPAESSNAALAARSPAERIMLLTSILEQSGALLYYRITDKI